MGKIKKIILSVLMLALLATTVIGSTTVSAEAPYNTYTYWDQTDGSTTAKPMKDIYDVYKVIDADTLGVASLGRINDVCTDKDGNIYILDGDKSTLYVLDSQYSLKQTITEVYDNGTAVKFEKARGIFVDHNGLLYISDTENARVICFDNSLNVNYFIELPDAEVIPEDFKYRPIRVAVDADNYVYILSEGSFYGLILCSPEKEFLGFFGSNEVKTTLLDFFGSLLDRLTTTNEKRSRTASKVPYQVSDAFIDEEGFVYTATGRGGSGTGQIKRFSRGGTNVLEDKNYADNKTISLNIGGPINRAQDFLGIIVDSDNFVYALDSTYGRIFVYDSESSLVCAFGGGIGAGAQDGTFKEACAIDINNDGEEVLVADSTKNTVTVFRITEYGKLVKAGCSYTNKGEYTDAKEIWHKVLLQDKNCQLAYKGLASAHYLEKDYENAMYYAQIGVDKEIYSNASAKMRTAYLKEHFYLLVAAIVALVAIVWFLSKKIKIGEDFKTKHSKLYNLSICVAHPFDAFDNVKYKDGGSTIISTVLVALFYISTVLKTTASNFSFSTYEVENFNSIFILVQTVGIVVLWSISNWSINQLVSGLATLKETYISISYSLIPVIAGNFIYTIGSHFISYSAGVFLEIISVIALLYTLFMLIVSTIKINDYSFGKFVGIALLSVAMMLLIVFLMFILVILAQQFIGFITTLVTEIKYF